MQKQHTETRIHSQSAAPLPELAAKINTEHEAASTAIRASLEHGRRAGELLLEAKSQVRHGEWAKWLAEHFQGSGRTARAYLQIARRWPEIESKMADSAVSGIDGALKLLAAPDRQAQLERCEAVIEEHIDEVERIFELSDLLTDALQIAGLSYPDSGQVILGWDGNSAAIELTGTDELGSFVPGRRRCHVAFLRSGEVTRTRRPIQHWLIVEWTLHAVGAFDWHSAVWSALDAPVLWRAT